MLILVKQQPTGLLIDPSSAFLPESEISDVWHFDTTLLQIVQSQVVGGSAFEMTVGQTIWVNETNGDVYRYAGDLAFTVDAGAQPTPPPTVHNLRLALIPLGAGTIQRTNGGNTFLAGETITIQATPAAGFEFNQFSFFGSLAPASTSSTFTFTAPDNSVGLRAFFRTEAEPEPPVVIENIVEKRYFPIELRVPGGRIPLEKILLRKYSNIFSSDFRGEYSLPFTALMNADTQRALNLPNDPQSGWNFAKSIDSAIWYKGNRLYKTIFDVTDGDNIRVKGTATLNSGFFVQQTKQLTLRDCYDADEIITLDEPRVAVGGYDIRFNFRDLRLQVNNFSRLFLRDQFEDHIEMLEEMAAFIQGLPLNLDVRIEYSTDLADEQSRIITWDTTVVSNITLAPTQGNSRFTRARRLTQERFNMDAWAQVDASKRIAFPQVYNRELYEGNNTLHDGIVNRYDPLGNLYVSNITYLSFSESFRWEHTIVPYLYLSDVIEKVFEKLKINVTGDFIEDELLKTLLLYNNRTLDFMQVTVNGVPSRRTIFAVHRGDADPDQEAFRYQNVHDLNIRLRNHAPAIPIIDFIKGLKNFFFLSIRFNRLENSVRINYLTDVILKEEPLDLSDSVTRVFGLEHEKSSGLAFTFEDPDPLFQQGDRNEEVVPDYTVRNFLAMLALDAEIEEICYVESISAYFRLTTAQEEEPFWDLYKFDMHTEDTEGKTPWVLNLYPLQESFIEGKKLPAIECTGNNPAVNLQNEDCGLRIMQFQGRQVDSLGRPYLFASCNLFNAREFSDTNQAQLFPRSEDSSERYKYLNSMLDGGKRYNTVAYLNTAQLNALSRASKIRIANITYVIDSEEQLLTEGDFAVVKLTMYKLKGK